MYETTIFLNSGKVIMRTFDYYPTQEMIISSGIKWSDISSYEVNY